MTEHTAPATSQSLFKATWRFAHRVRPGERIWSHTPYMVRLRDGGYQVFPQGTDHDVVSTDVVEIRTMEPLSSGIPDDCRYVWASVPGSARILWTRVGEDQWEATEPWGRWRRADSIDLIDPTPVPDERSTVRQVVWTEKELNLLPTGTAVLDIGNEVAQCLGGEVLYSRSPRIPVKDAVRYAPFIVIWIPER